MTIKPCDLNLLVRQAVALGAQQNIRLSSLLQHFSIKVRNMNKSPGNGETEKVVLRGLAKRGSERGAEKSNRNSFNHHRSKQNKFEGQIDALTNGWNALLVNTFMIQDEGSGQEIMLTQYM